MIVCNALNAHVCVCVCVKGEKDAKETQFVCRLALR